MIRTLLFGQELASMMKDGRATCHSAMAAITMYFRDHVYGPDQETFKHTAAIDMDVVNIMRSAFEHDEPHLSGLLKIEVIRIDEHDMTADLIVTLDEVYHHMLETQEGLQLCH
jgi:phenylalanyl-tRNA synthetase alpha subunit